MQPQLLAGPLREGGPRRRRAHAGAFRGRPLLYDTGELVVRVGELEQVGVAPDKRPHGLRGPREPRLWAVGVVVEFPPRQVQVALVGHYDVAGQREPQVYPQLQPQQGQVFKETELEHFRLVGQTDYLGYEGVVAAEPQVAPVRPQEPVSLHPPHFMGKVHYE